MFGILLLLSIWTLNPHNFYVAFLIGQSSAASFNVQKKYKGKR